jgi:Fic family protein
VDNIVKACNGIFKSLITGEYEHLTPEIIKGLNFKVLTSLPVPQNVIPGEVRKYFVGVGGYRGAPAEDCGYLLERLCDLVNTNRHGVQGLDPLSSSVLLAVVTHLYIAWIHPFGDGNGRTARLIELMLLLQGGRAGTRGAPAFQPLQRNSTVVLRGTGPRQLFRRRHRSVRSLCAARVPRRSGKSD